MHSRTFASVFMLGAGLACAQTTTPAATSLPVAAIQESRNVTVIIETSLGSMTAELDAEKAPLTVSNFLAYIDQKFYDGTIFHRVIPGFMIQGGGFTPQMRQKTPQAPIKNEAANGLKNDRGTLSMARTGDPNSATSQFFINHKDNAGLNRPNPDGHGYAVFGKVVEGLDVLDKIAAVPTGSAGGHQNVPVTAVEIKSIRRQAAVTK